MVNSHHTPAKYLSKFTNQEGKIYCIPRDGQVFASQPKSVGKINGFYSLETEAFLATKIEDPFTKTIEEVEKSKCITENEKKIIADYIVVFLNRTTAAKVKYIESVPEVIKTVTQETIGEIMRGEIFTDRDQDISINQAKEIEFEYLENPPQDIWETLLKPKPESTSSVALLFMNWSFLILKEPSYFITCDNPVFYFQDIGIGSVSYSNLSFPLTKNLLLLIHWSKTIKCGFINTPLSWVSELNKRSTFNTTQFAYSPVNDKWIGKYLYKNQKPHYLISTTEAPSKEFISFQRQKNIIMKKSSVEDDQ